MKIWIQEALEKWRESKVKLNPPTTITEFEKTEAILNFKFPNDFKALYALVNGFEDYDWQEHMFSFWSLNRIIEEVNGQNDFIGFCDFLIHSNVIGFRKSVVGVFKSYPSIGEEDWNPIAQTFEEAVQMINSSKDNIY